MDRATFNAIWLNRIYMPAGFEINGGDVVIDIGAHTGIFSIMAASAAENVRVYSFEPAQDNFPLLAENIKLNNKTNIEVFNCAMAGESGVKEMYFYPDNPSAHAFSSVAEKSGEEASVAAISLEEFAKKKGFKAIDFLKMNCEGAEYEILFNCPAKILKIVKKISIQCHDIDESKNINKMKIFLGKMGFNVKTGLKKYNMIYARQ